MLKVSDEVLSNACAYVIRFVLATERSSLCVLVYALGYNF